MDYRQVDKGQVASLMKTINEYYPVGITAMKPWFAGFEKYTQILTEKINLVISKERTPWVDFIEKLQSEFADSILDMDYLQFPCHLVKITLKKEHHSDYEFERYLVVNVSLLCNYYTLFFEDRFRFKDYTNDIIKPSITILFSRKLSEKVHFDDLVTKIESQLVKYFGNYSRINHKLLFDYKVEAVLPYTEGEGEQEVPFSFYQLLFDSFYKPNHFYVLD